MDFDTKVSIGLLVSGIVLFIIGWVLTTIPGLSFNAQIVLFMLFALLGALSVGGALLWYGESNRHRIGRM